MTPSTATDALRFSARRNRRSFADHVMQDIVDELVIRKDEK